MANSKLKELKNYLKNQQIDYFFLPNSDEFFSEYLPISEKRIEYLTGFDGSNAYLIIGQEKTYFFTDGRYILQAKQQLDLAEFEIFNIAEKSVIAWLGENLDEKSKLALDAKLSSVNFVKNIKANLVFLEQNPVDEIWQNRPKAPSSKVFQISEKLSGASFKEKCNQVLQSLEADALIITKPENLCWLLNIRAADIEFTPFLLAYAILYKNGKVDLFAAKERFAEVNLMDVEILEKESFADKIISLKESINSIQIDEAATNYWLYQLLTENQFKIISKSDKIEILKSQKNQTEIANMVKSHEVDGLAMIKFLCWLEKSSKRCLTPFGDEASKIEGLAKKVSDTFLLDEVFVAEKLLEFRRENSNFLYPSFATIAGFASNGAVIHYRACEKTNKKLIGNSLFLIDSGGQYYGDFIGTTDVTRTIAIGKPSAEMIENFTRVLKGHIALARVKFPRGISGAQLDVLARFHLWQAGLDYDHGTGHGVGCFLSVHEGPCGISKRANFELKEGMILSNEPGFYKEGQYGIRIENLMLVEKYDEKFLQFRTLTLVPIDPRLIDFKMLTYPEKKWLKEYHLRIVDVVAGSLDKEQRGYLEKVAGVFLT